MSFSYPSRLYFLALLAEAYGTIRQPAVGLEVLAEALTRLDTTRDRWYEPELYRLKGPLLLQQSADNHTEAQTCCHRALDIACAQQAESLKLWNTQKGKLLHTLEWHKEWVWGMAFDPEGVTPASASAYYTF